MDFKNIAQRFLVLFNLKPDPFDVYEEISKFCLENNVPSFWFFLFRSGTTFDRTIDPKSSAYQKVFNYLKSNKAHIGLHPSYNTSVNADLLNEEVKNLTNKSGENVLYSRQHFLRFNIKTTPQELTKNGIVADFTMGYASVPGFRAGTSFPFYYYDFHLEKEQNLLMVPFCVMDGAFTIYQDTSPDKALETMLDLAKEVKKVNGFFISVFHERTFSNHLYKGFGTLYKNLHLKLKQL